MPRPPRARAPPKSAKPPAGPPKKAPTKPAKKPEPPRKSPARPAKKPKKGTNVPADNAGFGKKRSKWNALRPAAGGIGASLAGLGIGAGVFFAGQGLNASKGFVDSVSELKDPRLQEFHYEGDPNTEEDDVYGAYNRETGATDYWGKERTHERGPEITEHQRKMFMILGGTVVAALIVIYCGAQLVKAWRDRAPYTAKAKMHKASTKAAVKIAKIPPAPPAAPAPKRGTK